MYKDLYILWIFCFFSPYFQVGSGHESPWGLKNPQPGSTMNEYLADAEFTKIKQLVLPIGALLGKMC